MKKLAILLLLPLLMACSSDDEPKLNEYDKMIIGRWEPSNLPSEFKGNAIGLNINEDMSGVYDLRFYTSSTKYTSNLTNVKRFEVTYIKEASTYAILMDPIWDNGKVIEGGVVNVTNLTDISFEYKTIKHIKWGSHSTP